VTTSFADCVGARLHEAPDRVAIVDGATRRTRAQLHADALRLGSALRRRGVLPGASVGFQLPNWQEACVVHLAAGLYGWRLVPLLPMYREAELAFMLRQCDVQVLFLPAEFRGTDYPALLGRALPVEDQPRHVAIVRGKPGHHLAWDALLAEGEAPQPPSPAEPDAVKMVLYTSGSTGTPKGVLHSARSVDALARFGGDFWDLTDADVALVPSPVAHIGGALYAFEFPWILGTTAVLMDSWSPEHAVDLIEAEGVSFLAGATPFLSGLLQAAQARRTALPMLRRFVCGGASVPPSLIERAAAHFAQCTVSRAYGSTEVPIICPGIRTRADAAMGATTDGECTAEVEIMDDAGHPVPEGEAGEIVARAPRMFIGYLDPRDNAGAFTPEGHFRMGDLGRRVGGRFLEITGRKKDIIIRLGENFSPQEVENVLVEHPAVRQVAIVGVPDARTGEAALAFVVPHTGATFTLEDMRNFLAGRGLAKQKCPEQLRIVNGLPTNSVGKVLKRELQRIAAEEPIPRTSSP
jgi:acyl-CoA synthetase (AMP-forming)/AMP-acid ligase II